MSDLNKVNRGFELMIPTSQKEEVTKRNIIANESSFKFFGFEFCFSISLSKLLEKKE